MNNDIQLYTIISVPLRQLLAESSSGYKNVRSEGGIGPSPGGPKKCGQGHLGPQRVQLIETAHAGGLQGGLVTHGLVAAKEIGLHQSRHCRLQIP